jgi:hypothetical protein
MNKRLEELLKHFSDGKKEEILELIEVGIYSEEDMIKKLTVINNSKMVYKG